MTAPTTDLPRIWYTRALSVSENVVVLNYTINRPQIDFVNDQRAWRPVSRSDGPNCLLFKGETTSIPKAQRDMFRITGGHIVVSPKLRDVLVQFDLGKTSLFEVPIYRSEAQDLSPYPPHYVLHVAETKPTFVSDASENVKQLMTRNETEPRPGEPIRS